jgi:hypothetical protein
VYSHLKKYLETEAHPVKGIVVEKEKEYAIVLNSKGQFLMIKNPQDLKIGYEIDIPSKRKIGIKTILAIAAAFMMVLGLSVILYSCHRHFC